MTTQIQDTFIYERKSWGLFGINGNGLFDPNDYNFKPFPYSSANWRGCVCTYEVIQKRLYLTNLLLNLREKGPRINNIEPKTPKHMCGDNLYENINLKMPFTGGLLIGTFSKEEFPVLIYELIFENGNIFKVRNLHEKTKEYLQQINSLDFGQKTNLIRGWFKLNYDPPSYVFNDSYNLVINFLDRYLSEKERNRLYDQTVKYCNKHSIKIPPALRDPYGPWIIIRTDYNPHRLSAVTGSSIDTIEEYIKGYYCGAHNIKLPLEEGKRFPLKIVCFESEKETLFYVNSEGDIVEDI